MFRINNVPLEIIKILRNIIFLKCFWGLLIYGWYSMYVRMYIWLYGCNILSFLLFTLSFLFLIVCCFVYNISVTITRCKSPVATNRWHWQAGSSLTGHLSLSLSLSLNRKAAQSLNVFLLSAALNSGPETCIETSSSFTPERTQWVRMLLLTSCLV